MVVTGVGYLINIYLPREDLLDFKKKIGAKFEKFEVKEKVDNDR
jgi:hypothetical protein